MRWLFSSRRHTPSPSSVFQPLLCSVPLASLSAVRPGQRDGEQHLGLRRRSPRPQRQLQGQGPRTHLGAHGCVPEEGLRLEVVLDERSLLALQMWERISRFTPWSARRKRGEVVEAINVDMFFSDAQRMGLLPMMSSFPVKRGSVVVRFVKESDCCLICWPILWFGGQFVVCSSCPEFGVFFSGC